MSERLITGKLPKRNARLIRRERRQPHATLTAGARVALGHGKGLRVGQLSHFRHDVGVLEGVVIWHDGLTTTIRLDALRPASRADRKAERRRRRAV